MRLFVVLVWSLAACGSPDPGAIAPDPSGPVVATPAPTASADGLVNGMTAPDFDLAVVGQPGTWRLHDHVAPDGHGAASAAIIAFTASWCGPCRESLPTLAALQAEHPEIVIAVLSIDDAASDRQKEQINLDAAGLTAPLLVADEATRQAWLGDNRHIPRFLFLNHVAEVIVQDRGFGDKVRPMMPKQLAFAIAHPEYVAR